MNLKHIFKIIEKDDLQKAKLSGNYVGSSKDIQDGYIHFSGEEQVESTLKKYYINQKKFSFIKSRYFKIRAFNLGASIRWKHVSTPLFTC